MDKSTIIFILTLLIAFIFLRWLISPIPHSVAGEFNLPDPDTTPMEDSNNRQVRRRVTRAVNQSMIEVVQAIGPQLTISQIRYSLERTGSVEATVEEYIGQGDLPFPPDETPVRRSVEAQVATPSSSVPSLNLLEKYNVKVLNATAGEVDTENLEKWGRDKEERLSILQRRKENMIMRARRRMEASLYTETNEADST